MALPYRVEVLNAAHHRAASFYKRCDFVRFPEHPLRLFSTMVSITAMMAAPDPPAP